MTDSEYTVRPFEPSDAEAFIEIFNRTWSAAKTSEWFEWRYLDNPYVEEIPGYVAEHEGEIVATRPYKAITVRSGDVERLAFHGVDSMTLPEHQRKGLFTRLNEAAIEDFTDRPEGERPAFVFTHSNENSKPGHRKMGVRYFGEMVRHTRVQRAGSYVRDQIGGLPGRVGSAVANALNRAYLRSRDRRTPFETEQFDVERHESVPVATLAGIAESNRPDTAHVVFDEAFHDWYFAEPDNQPEATYVVRWDGHPMAGVVLGRDYDERNDTTMVRIRHAVPAASTPEHAAAFAAAFEVLLGDYGDVDLLRTQLDVVPESVLQAYGFFPDDRFPMSTLADRAGLTFGLRPIPEESWKLDGRPIQSAESTLWTIA